MALPTRDKILKGNERTAKAAMKVAKTKKVAKSMKVAEESMKVASMKVAKNSMEVKNSMKVAKGMKVAKSMKVAKKNKVNTIRMKVASIVSLTSQTASEQHFKMVLKVVK